MVLAWLADFSGQLLSLVSHFKPFFGLKGRKAGTCTDIEGSNCRNSMKETKKNNHKRPVERHICPLERPTDGPSLFLSSSLSLPLCCWQTVLGLSEMRLSSCPLKAERSLPLWSVSGLMLESKEFVIWKIKFFGESTLMSCNEIRYSELLSVFKGYFVYSLAPCVSFKDYRIKDSQWIWDIICQYAR